MRNMIANQAFPYLRFSEPGPVGRATITWTDPTRIAVTVVADPNDPAAARSVSWPVEQDPGRALHALIGSAARLPGQDGQDYSLEVRGSDAAPAIRSWSAATETDPLREIRTALENLAQIRYTQALLGLSYGRSLAERGRRADAVGIFRRGIEALGDSYYGPELVDDTGTKLLLAENFASKGDWERAATVFDRVLEARLQVYAQRFHVPSSAVP
jgi:hypothetical protein